jgi:pimeloyl-ACP methyl ester carboxylesterase
MLTMRRACMVAILLTVMSGVAVARECPPIPGEAPPPFKDKTPDAPEQIIDQNNRHHFEGPGPEEGTGYCLYMPPSAADGLILFLHGFQFGAEVGAYDPMVQFLAKSGYYVVYAYGPDLWSTGFYPQRAIAALNDALSVLKAQYKVDIRKLAVVGHSLGGLAAVRVAAEWKGAIPMSALVSIDPGPPTNSDAMLQLKAIQGSDSWDIDEGLKAIPCATRLLIIQAQSTANEQCICPTHQSCNCPAQPPCTDGCDLTLAQLLWQKLRQIARYTGSSGQTPQRNFLRVPNDTSHSNPGHGVMGITVPSTHLAPTVIPPLSCSVLTNWKSDYGCYLTYMDSWGYWRPTLTAVREAFTGKPDSPDYSPYCSSTGTAGTCATTRDMGKWVDGIAATPMKNAAEIPELVTTYPEYCGK